MDRPAGNPRQDTYCTSCAPPVCRVCANGGLKSVEAGDVGPLKCGCHRGINDPAILAPLDPAAFWPRPDVCCPENVARRANHSDASLIRLAALALAPLLVGLRTDANMFLA